jgi:hypothetical protein
MSSYSVLVEFSSPEDVNLAKSMLKLSFGATEITVNEANEAHLAQKETTKMLYSDENIKSFVPDNGNNLVFTNVSKAVSISKLVDSINQSMRQLDSSASPSKTSVCRVFSLNKDSVKGETDGFRKLTPPGFNAVNRADMLVVIEDELEKRLPLFVSCTDDPSMVIDTVLSVYIRRGRMPEPGEVVFCTADTTLEDLYLILLRFLRAKQYGGKDSVFCLADIHNLTYSQQCSFVEMLRQLLEDIGQSAASTLLLVSGLPKQVILNSFSSQEVDLPPLSTVELRKACAEAFRLHVNIDDIFYVLSSLKKMWLSSFTIIYAVWRNALCGQYYQWRREESLHYGKGRQAPGDRGVHCLLQGSYSREYQCGEAGQASVRSEEGGLRERFLPY